MPNDRRWLRSLLAACGALAVQLLWTAAAAAVTGGGDFPRFVRLIERL